MRYELRSAISRGHLEDVQWAEWDASGRLLVATDDGRLQIRDVVDGSVSGRRTRARSGRIPTPPPAEASIW